MEQQMDPQLQGVVLVGMKIIYNQKILPMFKEGLEAKAPWPIKLASQVAGLMKLIDDKLPEGIPAKLVAPAAQLLLFDMVRFIYQVGGPKLKQETIQQAMPILKKLLLEIFGKHSKGAKKNQPAQADENGVVDLRGQGQQQPMPQQQQGGMIAQGA